MTSLHWDMGAHVVYAHIAPGHNAPFYVGSGTAVSGRPFRGGRWRTAKWNAKVASLGGKYRVAILSIHDTAAQARVAEAEAIREYQPEVNVIGLKKSS
jgi:hypothetical protein